MNSQANRTVVGVLKPAAIDGIPLLDGGHDSGAVFVLDEQATRSAVTDADDDWAVEVRAQSRVVVARGRGASSAAEAHALGIQAAQHGLDMLSIRGLGDLLIRRAEDESLVWWQDDERFVVRASSIAAFPLEVPSITVRLTDSPGNAVSPPPPPKPVWHPSFRYFRLAQVSEEVFDAYRNLFLALESVLSTASPKNSDECEKPWIRRALQEASTRGVNVAAHAPAGASDPVGAIIRDLYSGTRIATFHAKANRRALLPLDAVDRREVLASLTRLAGLYLDLVRSTLGIRRPSNFMFKGGFDMLVGRVADELQVHVTDDPERMSETHTVINPGGGRVRALATRPSPELDQPFLRTFIGEVAVAELAGLTHVARVVAMTPDGDPFSGGQLEGRLTIGGFDVFQAAMGFRGLNVGLPRTFYEV